MALREDVREQVKTRTERIETNFFVLACIYNLIEILNNCNDPEKDVRLKLQEELKVEI